MLAGLTPEKASKQISKRLTASSIALISALTMLAAGVAFSLPVKAAAAEETGSADSMWVDQAAKEAAEKTAPAATEPAAAPAAEATAAATSSTTIDTLAPLCKLSEFKDSTLFSKGGWPGVGPFKSGNDASEFVDDKQNKVKIELDGDQVTRAELTLSNWQQNRDPVVNVLNAQMNADFLLESVGIKAKRIQELNKQIERKRQTLFGDGGTTNLVTGRYAVTFARHGADYSISVNSMDASKKVIKNPVASKESEPAPIRIAVENPTSRKPTANSANKAQLKSEFLDLITSWQNVKQKAVKTRQSDPLAAVLSGKALVRQTDAIKWLVTNHRYYDMTPRGVVIDRFTEILPAKKYMVAAQVREAYKFIDEPTGKVLKEVDDVNKVNYTVEKINGKWVITDSALLSAANSNNRTYSANKSTH